MVLANKVNAKIIAVRRSDRSMDMKIHQFRVGQKHTSVVIELDQRHRALDVIVKGTVNVAGTDPAEMGIIKLTFDIAHLGSERPRR